LDKPMRLHSTYFISVLGAAFGALCFAVTLALPTTMVGPKPGAEPSISDQTSDTISGAVNRASKGDRMRVIVRPPDAEPFEVQAPEGASPKPRDGCESAFGQMDHSSAARLAQRCMT
jgi:hypothetical protein